MKNKKQYHPTFGAKLRQIRKHRGISSVQLADNLGISNPYQTISAWENGIREPSLFQVTQIAKFLDITTDALLLGDETWVSVSEKQFELNLLARQASQDELPEPAPESPCQFYRH